MARAPAAARTADGRSSGQYPSSFGFFDAEGLRFHLPAYLLAHLRGDDLVYDVRDSLTDVCDLHRQQFALLDAPQRRAVRAFLLLTCGSDIPTDPALAEYWPD